MKSLFASIICLVLLSSAAVYACTDPTPKKAIRTAEDATVVYEYFRPAKLAEKKKASRPLSDVADSLLTNARSVYESETTANSTALNVMKVSANVKGTHDEYREQAEFELYKIKSWADSICNSFRRGYYKIGSEDAPR